MDFGFLKGKTVILTGATGVIGSEICQILAGVGARIVMVVRDFKKGDQLRDRIFRYRGCHPCTQLTILKANLEETDSVLNLVNEIRSEVDTIDILINCAGITPANYFLIGGRSRKNAPDTIYSVNVLAPFIIMRGIMRNLEKAKNPFVLSVSSRDSLKHGISIALDEEMTVKRCYAQSKRCLNLLTYQASYLFNLEKDRHGKEMTVACVDPGLVYNPKKVNWATNLLIRGFVMFVTTSPREASKRVLYPTLYRDSGYYENNKLSTPPPEVGSPSHNKQVILWNKLNEMYPPQND